MKIINFEATDGIKLNGILYDGCKDTSKDVVLAIHGMSSNCFKKRDEIIAKYANDNNLNYFCFNNRGSELVRYLRKNIDGNNLKQLGGTSYEDVLEGYNDIVGAINYLKTMGFENIYLQGHSLGCTKAVYTYNRLKTEQNNEILNSIKAIILLSLIDIPSVLKVYLNKNYNKYLNFAEEKELNNQNQELMPIESFIHPISVQTFLRYAKNNQEIDFINLDTDKNLSILNNIKIPLFMRYGNQNEMILKEANEYVSILNKIIKNEKKDIDFIDKADHGYNGKEEILAEQIINFVKQNKIV